MRCSLAYSSTVSGNAHCSQKKMPSSSWLCHRNCQEKNYQCQGWPWISYCGRWLSILDKERLPQILSPVQTTNSSSELPSSTNKKTDPLIFYKTQYNPTKNKENSVSFALNPKSKHWATMKQQALIFNIFYNLQKKLYWIHLQSKMLKALNG